MGMITCFACIKRGKASQVMKPLFSPYGGCCPADSRSKQGVKYIVYAYAKGKNNEFLGTGSCTRTKTTMLRAKMLNFWEDSIFLRTS